MKITAVFAIAGTLAARSAAAQESPRPVAPWHVLIDLGGQWHSDPAIDAFAASRGQFSSGIALGRDLVSLGDHATLGADLAWRIEAQNARVQSSFQSKLYFNTFAAGLALRFRAASWLEPYARGSIGAGYTTLALSPNNGNAGDLSGDAWTLVGTAGAGAQITTGRLAGRLRFTFAMEGGYLFAMTQTMSVQPDAVRRGNAPSDALAVAPTPLGSLNLGGGYLRALVGVRF